MSRIRTNLITNRMANGAPTVSNGLVISGVTTVTTLDLNGDLDVDGHLNADNVSIAGIVTATSFVGSGANLTSLPAQATIANNADNRIITGGSGVNLNGESTLTYNGSTLIFADTTGDAYIQYGAHSTTANNFLLGTQGDGTFRLFNGTYASGTERLRITSSGQMGLGVSSLQANAKLQVNGNIGASQFYTTTTSAPQTDFNSDVATNKAGLLIRRSSETNGDYGGIEFHNHPSSNTSYRKGGIYFQSDGSGFGRGDMVFVNDGAGDAANLAISDEKMRIHKEGYVTKPYQVAWAMHGSSAQNITGGTRLSFNVNGTGFGSFTNRNHGGVNTSNHSFTVPVTGLYSITVTVFFYTDNNTNTCSLVPYKNDSPMSNGNDTIFILGASAVNANVTYSGTVLLQLNANDKIDIRRRNGEGGTSRVYLPHSYFSGFLVG